MRSIFALLLLSAACNNTSGISGDTTDEDEVPRTGTRPIVEAVDSAPPDTGTPPEKTETGSTGETGVLTEFDCADGEDDDKDKLIDCDDPDCDFTPDCSTEICDDNIDNDGNALPDCLDPSCALEEHCDTSCADAVLTDPLPITHTGSTAGAGRDINPSTCGYSTAPELAFAYIAPEDGNYTFTTAGSAYDTLIYVFDGCGGREIACNDDAIGLQSSVSTSIRGGEVVIVVVDGYATSSGNFQLNIRN